MAMESYFVSLLEMSGAEEIVLLRDDRASSTCLLGEEKKKDMIFRRTASLPSYGPPSRPLRKDSSENLQKLDQEGGPSAGDSLLFKSNGTKSPLRNVFSDIVQSQDDHHRARRSHQCYPPKAQLKEILNEVEIVLGGFRTSSLNMDMSRKESRWT
jgi:hypothetical protein